MTEWDEESYREGYRYAEQVRLQLQAQLEEFVRKRGYRLHRYSPLRDYRLHRYSPLRDYQHRLWTIRVELARSHERHPCWATELGISWKTPPDYDVDTCVNLTISDFQERFWGAYTGYTESLE